MSDTQIRPLRRPLVPAVPGPKTTNSEKGVVTAGLGAPAPIERPRPRAAYLPGPIGNIAKGISGVMSEVGTIEKGGYNSFHKYHYARMEDLLKAITPLIGKHGLAIIQNEVEIKQIENRVAVTYEFSIIHSSGEMWPERPRFTGMCIARNSKGDWDDKALNKCHTSARKYFLLALFQVPAGDFEEDQGDADKGDANQRKERGPVPGPKTISEKAVAAREAQKDVATGPHRIVLGQGIGADQWASAYIKGIGTATTLEEINQWDKLNDQALQAISERYSAVYEMIEAATQRRLEDLNPKQPSDPMPSPVDNPQEAMNWVASQLQQFNTYEAAEAFWNTVVAPHEQDFDTTDWEMLMKEWQRAETRLTPEQEEK